MNISLKQSSGLFSRIGGAVQPKGPQAPVLLNECPEVIGKMAVDISGGSSIEHAIRQIQSEGPPTSRKLFSAVVMDADTRIEPNMKAALNRQLSALPESCGPYASAVRMILSASESKTEAERTRLIDEARRIALNGLKDIGKAFSSSLNLPFLLIFGAGIMIPMVLMSVLPMLNAGGLFGKTAISPVLLAVVTLVIIPAVLLVTVAAIRERNPFRTPFDKNVDTKAVAALACCAPLTLILMRMGIGSAQQLCIGQAASCGIVTAVMMCQITKDKTDEATEKLLKEALYDLGNHLVQGMPFEESLEKALAPLPGGDALAQRFEVELKLGRGDGFQAIRSIIGPISADLTGAYSSVYSAQQDDLYGAGQLALSLAKQLEEQDTVRKSIRTELKNMTDTMSATAMLFAPLVLGLGISIMGPMQKIADADIGQGSALITGIYLIELCAVIAVMLSAVRGEGKANGILRTFAMMVPASMIVYLIALCIKFRREGIINRTGQPLSKIVL